MIMSGYDDMEILVTGNDQRIMVTSLFDKPRIRRSESEKFISQSLLQE